MNCGARVTRVCRYALVPRPSSCPSGQGPFAGMGIRVDRGTSRSRSRAATRDEAELVVGLAATVVTYLTTKGST